MNKESRILQIHLHWLLKLLLITLLVFVITTTIGISSGLLIFGFSPHESSEVSVESSRILSTRLNDNSGGYKQFFILFTLTSILIFLIVHVANNNSGNSIIANTKYFLRENAVAIELLLMSQIFTVFKANSLLIPEASALAMLISFIFLIIGAYTFKIPENLSGRKYYLSFTIMFTALLATFIIMSF